MSYLTKMKLNGISYDIRDADAYARLNILNGDSSISGSVQQQITTALKELRNTSFKIVEELPDPKDAEDGVIYLIDETGTKSGSYIEYVKVKIGDEEYSLEKIGSTDMDLDDYESRVDAAELAKKILEVNEYKLVDDILPEDGYTYITLIFNDNLSGTGTTNSDKNGTFSGKAEIGINHLNKNNLVYKRENIVYQSQLKHNVDVLNKRIDNEVDTLNTRVNNEVQTLNDRVTQEVTTINQQTGLSSYVTIEMESENVGTINVNNVEVLQPRTTRIIPSTDWYSDEIKEYTLSSPEEFMGIPSLVNSGKSLDGVTINLSSDLDFKGQEVTPIGKIDSSNITSLGNLYKATAVGEKVFKGTFNGNGHTLSNFRIAQSTGTNSGTNSGIGLFGIVDGGATIENVNFNNVSIDTKGAMVGSVVGYIPRTNTEKVTTIRNVTITGNININGYVGVGGIVGRIEAGNNKVIIENCSIIGNDKNTSIITSYAKNGFAGVGGIVGCVYGNTDNIIRNCTVQNVTITSPNEANGGIVGHFEHGTLEGNRVSNIRVCDTLDTKVYMQEASVVGALIGTIDSTIKAATTEHTSVILNNNVISDVEIHIPSTYTNTGNAVGVKLDDNGYPDWKAWPIVGSPRNTETRDPTPFIQCDVELETLKNKITIIKD